MWEIRIGINFFILYQPCAHYDVAQWFPKSGPRIPRNLRPFPRDPCIHLCNCYFGVQLLLNERNNGLSRTISEILSLAMCLFCVISGFRREADKNCVLLGYNAASRSNSLPTFQDNLSVPSSRAMLSRNVGKELLLIAA